MKDKITLALKGMAMGIAEVIPGVSGGTIAFITGIYEQLLNSIKAVGPELFTALKKDGISGAWAALNGNFLLNLMIGMVLGVVFGVLVVTELLESYPVLLWAFFFGLIIASAIYIGKQVDRWNVLTISSLLIGLVVAYGITVAVPTQGNPALWFVFLSGMIAISALILPGISGSFILLLMGMYTIIVPSVKNILTDFNTDSFIIVFVFALGALAGLATFSRVLSWTFKNYPNPTLALLTGFMVGSLNKIWPWRIATAWLTDATTGEFIVDKEGVKKVLSEQNLSPFQYATETGLEPYMILAIVMMIIGFASVFVLERFGKDVTP
ncbi:MAG: DUF368 domain-containing protein [Saprospiraceae bacterium]